MANPWLGRLATLGHRMQTEPVPDDPVEVAVDALAAIEAVCAAALGEHAAVVLQSLTRTPFAPASPDELAESNAAAIGEALRRAVERLPPPRWPAAAAPVELGRVVALSTMKAIALSARWWLDLPGSADDDAKLVEVAREVAQLTTNGRHAHKLLVQLQREARRRETPKQYDGARANQDERRAKILAVIRRHRRRPQSVQEVLRWLADAELLPMPSKDTVARDLRRALELGEARPDELPPR